MAPPLALVAKRQFPLECQAIIQEYAADKRAPHPVALLVKSINVEWDLDHNFNEIMTIDFKRINKGWTWYSWRVDALEGDGIFTNESVKANEEHNKYLKRCARHDTDRSNSKTESPFIHKFFKEMRREMQGCKYMTGSLSSCPRRRGRLPLQYKSETWPARGWDKRGSKRKRVASYKCIKVDSDSDDSDF